MVQILSVGVGDVLLVFVKVQIPLLVLIADFPVNDALILDRASEQVLIVEVLDALNHTGVRVEKPRRSHVTLLNEVEVEVRHALLVQDQAIELEEVEAA